jgi:hypothetical protein
MKIAIFCLIVLFAGCSQRPAVTDSLPQEQSESPSSKVTSREQAITIASGAHNMEYHRDGQIEVELTNGQYIVTFPVDKTAKPGTRYRGPDYAAKVWVDAQTGKVLKALQGS